MSCGLFWIARTFYVPFLHITRLLDRPGTSQAVFEDLAQVVTLIDGLGDKTPRQVRTQ